MAADDWKVDELFALCRRSHCYRDLARDDFDGVLDMLAGNYRFDTEFPPYPKISWDKVNEDVPSATAILDRFLQHAEIITFTGKSYRLKNRACRKKARKS